MLEIEDKIRKETDNIYKERLTETLNYLSGIKKELS